MTRHLEIVEQVVLGVDQNDLVRQRFKDEVEKYLTGETKPSELIYFKIYRSQLTVIEQALEVAARMLGTDMSRGYCLEMICVDFLAGVNATDLDQSA